MGEKLKGLLTILMVFATACGTSKKENNRYQSNTPIEETREKPKTQKDMPAFEGKDGQAEFKGVIQDEEKKRPKGSPPRALPARAHRRRRKDAIKRPGHCGAPVRCSVFITALPN